MDKYIIALDQGTTSSRAILFDKNGKSVLTRQKEFTQIYPKGGWVEHDATEILNTQMEVFNQLIKDAKVTPNQINGIGITNQRETVVIWDKTDGNPIYNAIVWQDTRTAHVCQKMKQNLELSNYINDQTGLVVDSYFSATKIQWILQQIEHTKENLLIGTIDTWLLWNLTKGRNHATDYSNASRTMLFNIHSLAWDERLVDYFGVSKNMLPEVKNSSDDFGYYELDGVKIPITGIAGDQQAALFGQGCFEKGQAKNTYGTGCFMLMNTGKTPKPSKKGLLTTIAWGINNEVNYALEGSVFIAGAAIQWLRDELKIIEHATDTEEMIAQVNSDEIYVVPAFVGLGAPHWDEDARGTIFGLTRDAGKNHLVKGTVNALAFQARDIFDLMEKESGIELKELAVDGGASQNKYLMQFQADILNKDIVKPQNHETTALGAAFLAGLHTGFWTKDELIKLKQQGSTFHPKMSAELRDNKYKRWQKAVNLSKGWLSLVD